MKRRAVVAETLGTGLLLFMIVGSGIAAERLSVDPGVTLMTHAAVVGASLTVLIWMFGSVSGAHFNPVVTLALWRTGAIGRRLIPSYLGAQIGGGISGALLANMAYGESAVAVSSNSRFTVGTALSEVVVTLVLVLLILVLVRTENTALVAPGVGIWVAAAIFGTSSTGFANPAVTLSRTITNTYTGIHPESVTGFVVAQFIGMVVAIAAALILVPDKRELV